MTKEFVKTKCGECEKEISLDSRTLKYKQTKNKSGKVFCSNKCSSIFNREIALENLSKYNEDIRKGIRVRPLISLKDEYSPFRVFLNGSKSKAKYSYNDLTLSYLKELYDNQKGKCAITNIEMFLPTSVSDYRYIKGTKPLHTASLDRIDSFKPYMQGNVQFVCKGINSMKNIFSMEETLEFLNKIKENY